MDFSKSDTRDLAPVALNMNQMTKEASLCNHRSPSGDARTKRRLSRRRLARSNSNSDEEITDRDSGCALEEYTWVPPNLSPDQVDTIAN